MDLVQIIQNTFRKHNRRLLRMFAVFLTGAALWAYSGQIIAHAAENQWQTEDVEEFVRSYYESKTVDRMADAWNMRGDDTIFDQAMLESMADYGLQGFEVRTVLIYPLSEPGVWLSGTAYELVVEESEIKLPGFEMFLVQEQEDGRLLIFTEDISHSLQDEVRQILNEQEIVALIEETDSEFSEILMKHPEVMEWMQDISYQASIRYGEAQLKEKKPENDLYMVQKGDCLWHIAEEQLGDGSRWTELYDANKAAIGDDPNLILIGMELRIP